MKIEILFPELANLYGDLANVDYLAKSAPGTEVIRTGIKSRPYFADETPGLIFMCSMTERAQEIIAGALLPYRERVRQLIDDGAAFLITGNALEIFGQYIEKDGGDKIETLGIFPTYAERRMAARYNSLYWGKFGDDDIFGFKDQFSHSYGDAGEGLFSTVRGAGLHPGMEMEGIRHNRFIATYLLGPVLILNPPFAKWFLRMLGIEEPKIAFEDAAAASYEQRKKEFTNPNTGYEY